MTALGIALDQLPARLARLPVARGYPLPWFVAWLDDGKGGKAPDFRVVDTRKVQRAHAEQRCFICGGRLGRAVAFVIGPMCAVNRVSAEPPSHAECCEWSAVVCPFLSRPDMRRRDHDYPQQASEGAGHMIKRNPGVSLVWRSETYRRVTVPNGHLWDIGHPVSIQAYREGREATKAEIVESIGTGLPLLAEATTGDEQALAQLTRMLETACRALKISQVDVLAAMPS